MNDVNSLLQTLRNLGPLRLASLGAIGFALIAFFVFVVARMTSPGYGLLYSGLDPSDSSAIVQRLDTQNIPYQLKADGAEILVPQDQVTKLRLSLAGEGIPSGGSIGYEIFDRADALGTTNFVQQINQIRALEGELSRTIRSLKQVKSARVHLVMPKRELFSRDQAEPTASVVLILQGSTLDKEQVSAIQHLVSSSIPGMKANNVSVIDNKGNLLARGADGGDGQDSASMEDMRRSYETRLTRSIEDLLAQTLGPDKIRAEVNADLDFNQVTTNTENFNPDGQVVRSTQTVEENDSSNERQQENNVSVANNIPNPPAQQGGAGSNSQSQNQRNEETVNYEISKTTQVEVKQSGNVKRISAAVLVDGTYTTDANGNQVYAPRPQAELDQIATLVKSSIGFDQKRGDVVEVVNMQFTAPDATAALPFEIMGFEKQDLMRIAELLVLSVIAVLVLLLVVRPLLNRLLALPGVAQPGLALAGPAGAALPPGAAAALAIPGPGGVAALPGMSAADGMLEADNMAEEIDQMIDINQVEGRVRASSLKRISDLVNEHPEQAMNIMRGWMNADQ
ncbi:flagellar basal-body MS-ring/collar protein FliF [Dongia sp.]|uniref:flagellar basal-body MS-ring/collar protein FliF n=1 Tax=Dongia sp. TaxID=1977262 RepID=UPI0037505C03